MPGAGALVNPRYVFQISIASSVIYDEARLGVSSAHPLFAALGSWFRRSRQMGMIWAQ
jgi:hypothetical protein